MSRILARTQTCSLPQVEARLAELGAERLPSSRWRCTCNYLRSEELFVLHTMEAPSEHFIVTKAAGGGERVLRAGAELEPLIEKAQACAQRLNVLIEGSVYACGDFVVRVGQLFLNKGTLTGVAVEVEYLPCTLATAAGLDHDGDEAQPLRLLTLRKVSVDKVFDERVTNHGDDTPGKRVSPAATSVRQMRSADPEPLPFQEASPPRFVRPPAIQPARAGRGC